MGEPLFIERITSLMDTAEKLSLLYQTFQQTTITELETRLEESENREEKILLRALINLKLQLAQEKVVGEILL